MSSYRTWIITKFILLALMSGTTSAHARESQETASMVDAACQEREPCQLAEKHDAGFDDAGHTLTVLELVLDTRTHDHRNPAHFEEACIPFEYWLVKTLWDDPVVVESTLLYRACNDGYGAAGIGMDEVEVGPNRFEVRQSGGSAWRWQNGLVLRLSPLQILEEQGASYWSVSLNTAHWEWDWEQLEGSAGHQLPLCRSHNKEAVYAEYSPIPRVSLPPEILSSGHWKDLGLSSCSATVQRASGRFSVVMPGPQTLLLELDDDRLMDGDAIEFWTGESPDVYGCIDATSRPTLNQHRVVLDKGQWKSATLSVESTSSLNVLRVDFPHAPQGLSIYVHDLDALGEPPTVLSTQSAHRGFAEASVGLIFDIEPSVGTCSALNNELVFQDKRTFDPQAPAAELSW